MNETPPRRDAPSDEGPAAAEPQRGGRTPFGCLTRIALVIVAAVALIIVIGETFDQGPNAKQPKRGVDAGPADQYPPGDLTYLGVDHVYVVRLEEGSYLALYDKSAKAQESNTNCRVQFDESAQLLGLAQLPGFSGAFIEECEGGPRATWRADGVFASGASYGDLDRFSTRIDGEGNLIINTRSRTCTRSRGVNGLPPYDVTTCTGTPE